MEYLLYILSGAGVGLAVGLTGIGGGSLMTPILIMFGFPMATAIGTDLLYAAITKANGVFMHYKRSTIDWRIVLLLSSGSIPSSLLTAYFLRSFFSGANDYQHILTVALGTMLILTACVLFFRDKIHANFVQMPSGAARIAQKYNALITVTSGIFLGVFVTLSSVGAGAFGTAILIMLYPHLRTVNIVGTDLAHAVPLTLIAGLGHLFLLGNVDLILLGCLLSGSIPAVYLGTHLGTKMPEYLLRIFLATILLVLGLKFVFFDA